jgi:hypothetical protein
MPTLDELKAENAAETAKEKPAETPQDDYSPEPESDKPEKVEAADTVEDEQEEGEESEQSTDWLTPEEDDGLPKDGPIRSGDAKALRRKYQGKLSEKDEELEQLKQKYVELEKKVATPQTLPATQIGQEPQRDQFANDAEWIRALTTYNAQVIQHQSSAQAQQAELLRRREEMERKTKSQTDKHYERVDNLVKNSKGMLSEEAANAADQRVRKAVNSVFPQAGDNIVDTLIASLGDGSEKVITHFGLKAPKLNRLIELLEEDRSGIKASAYLGQEMGKLTAPVRKDSRAPDPIDKVQGDKAGASSSERLRRDIAAARKKGDISGVIKLKQQGKAQKIDVSKM